MNINEALSKESKENLDKVNEVNYEKNLSDISEIRELYDQLKAIYDNYDIVNIFNTRYFDPKSDQSKILLNEIFTVDGLNNENSEVFKEYLKLNKYYEKKLTYGNINFKLKFYFNDKSNLLPIIIKRFHCLIKMYENTERFKHITKCMNNEDFDVYFLLYPVNRHVPFKQSKNINLDLKNFKNNGTYNCSSGYTTFFGNRRHMLMTRIPECLGLLTHELGHLLGWDLSDTVVKEDMCTLSGMVNNINLSNKQQHVINKLPLNNKNIIPYEVFCNTYTTILHTVCNSLEKNLNFNECLKMLNNEIIYSIYHSAKILHFNGFNSYDKFFMNSNSNKLLYYQDAALFEYTILRSFLLMNLQKMFKIGYESKNKKKILNLALESAITYNKNYEMIFNNFIKFIKNIKYEKLNMEYFLYDFISYDQMGGRYINYHKQYLKYIRRYNRLNY